MNDLVVIALIGALLVVLYFGVETYKTNCFFSVVLDRWEDGVRGNALFDAIPPDVVNIFCRADENDSPELRAIGVYARTYLATVKQPDA